MTDPAQKDLAAELSAQIHHKLIEGLAASDRQLRTLLKNLDAAVFSCDAEGVLTWVNRGWASLVGMTTAECIGRSLAEFIGEDASRMMPLLGSDWSPDLEQDFLFGSRWMRLVTVNALGGPKGGVLIDVTEQRLSKQAERERALLDIAVGDVTHMLLSCTSVADILPEVWDTMAAPAGLRSGRVILRDKTSLKLSERWTSKCQGVESYKVGAKTHTVPAGVTAFSTGEMDGSSGVMLVQHPAPMTSNIVAALRRTASEIGTALLRERTLAALHSAHQAVEERTEELSAANTRLAAASRSKDEFLASMSHELRTPLHVILAMSESLQEGIYGPMSEQQKGSVGIVEESGRHLLSLINDILDLTKVESGTIDLSMETVIVEHLCHASVRLIKAQAHKKRLTVTTAFDQQVTTIRTDKRRLKQILVNLLNNAVKFTPEGGAIGLEVAGSAENNVVHFSVWDTGIGITPEEHSHLFKPFFQLDAGLNRQHEGTGLGLSLVARMTEVLGGAVHLESLGRGQGSRFSIALPWSGAVSGAVLRRSPDAPDPLVPLDTSPVSNTESAADSPPLILIADDNESSLTTTGDFLQAQGYRTVVARDGVEAVDLTRQEHPDLILMDIQMPRLDGLDATREIRKDPDSSGVPIIALTALAMAGDRERCLAAGANDYMTKPVGLRKLSETINMLLSEDLSEDAT